MNDDRLTKKLLLYDKSQCKSNWSSDFKSLCNSVGMGDKFNTLIKMNVNTFTMNIKANYDTKWKADLLSKPKLRTYIKFKDDYNVEDYVKFCNSRRKHSLLAPFRMGISLLAIETGRFKGINVCERYCKFCPNAKVEDELHMLCQCSLYCSIRSVMFNNVIKNVPEFYHMNIEKKLTHLLMHEWKYVSDFFGRSMVN